MKKILLIILGIFLFNACMTNDYYYISPTGEKSKIVKPNPPIKIEKNEVINKVSIYQYNMNVSSGSRDIRIKRNN